MKTFVLAFLLVLLLSEAHSQNTVTQTVRGTIKDASSKTPLIGATIVIDGSNPIIGTTAGSDGEFRLEKVPVGRHNLTINLLPFTQAIFCAGMYDWLRNIHTNLLTAQTQ